jgi:hypothetical protein
LVFMRVTDHSIPPRLGLERESSLTRWTGDMYDRAVLFIAHLIAVFGYGFYEYGKERSSMISDTDVHTHTDITSYHHTTNCRVISKYR